MFQICFTRCRKTRIKNYYGQEGGKMDNLLLEDILVDRKHSAVLLRLKVSLLGLARTKREYLLIDLLCQGHNEADVAKLWNTSKSYVSKVMKKYRNHFFKSDIED